MWSSLNSIMEWTKNERVFPYLLYLFFITTALLNFVPQIMGFTLVDPQTGLYPDYLYNLSDSFQYKASLAVTAPIIGDYLLGHFAFLFEDVNSSTKQKQGSHMCYNYQQIFLLLVVPDILILSYVLPYQKYDFFPGLVSFRDTMYIFSFLSFMVQMKIPIWNWKWSFWVCFSLACSNILATFQMLYTDPNFAVFFYYLLIFTISMSIGILFVMTTRWFIYLWAAEDKAHRARNNLCSICVISFVLFILADWVPLYIPPSQMDEDWIPGTGVSYMTMYTYFMTLSFVTIMVVSSRLTRIEATEFQVQLNIAASLIMSK